MTDPNLPQQSNFGGRAVVQRTSRPVSLVGTLVSWVSLHYLLSRPDVQGQTTQTKNVSFAPQGQDPNPQQHQATIQSARSSVVSRSSLQNVPVRSVLRALQIAVQLTHLAAATSADK
jgi:hypothetical protein